jgi:hypothetical protein
MGGSESKESKKLQYNKEIIHIQHVNRNTCYIRFTKEYFANTTVKLDKDVQIIETRQYQYDKVLLPQSIQHEIIYSDVSSIPSEFHHYTILFSNGKFNYKPLCSPFNINDRVQDTASKYIKVGAQFYKRKLVLKYMSIRVKLTLRDNVMKNNNLIKKTLNDNISNSVIELKEYCNGKMRVKSEWTNIILNLLKSDNLHLMTALISPRVVKYTEYYIKYDIKDIILDEKLLQEKSISKDELNKEISSGELNNEDSEFDKNHSVEGSTEAYYTDESAEAHYTEEFPTATVIAFPPPSNSIMDEKVHGIPEAVPIDES